VTLFADNRILGDLSGRLHQTLVASGERTAVSRAPPQSLACVRCDAAGAHDGARLNVGKLGPNLDLRCVRRDEVPGLNPPSLRLIILGSGHHALSLQILIEADPSVVVS
jgi:hypothetical protein